MGINAEKLRVSGREIEAMILPQQLQLQKGLHKSVLFE